MVLGDRYELGAVLGRGGMADVYRATDRLLHREVAIKVLRETTENDADRRRFTSEATMLAGLSHPGLVMVLDAGFTAEQPYLVLELVEGPTLGQACASGPLDPDRVAEIGAQLAEALASAHAQGVVHRDVKPGNVLLGTDGRVKLADFGIARLLDDTVRHTKTGHAIGTPAFLSPEQVRGDEITTAVDIYSLGLVLLEALTGERAYPGSATEAALARLSRPPAMPASLPAHWRELLVAMTATEPGDRPGAAGVATRLRTDGSDPSRPVTTRLLPHPVPVTGVAGTGIQGTVGATWAAWSARLAEVPPHLRAVAAAVGAILLLILIAGLASGGPASQTPPQSPTQQPVQEKSTSPGSGQSTTPVTAPASSPVAPKDHGKGHGKGKKEAKKH